MKKLGCLLSILLFIIPAIAFSPLLIAPADLPAPLGNVMTSLLCGSGDKTVVRETYRESYHRPGEVGVDLKCRDNETGAVRDETGRFVVLVMASIVIPTLGMIFWAFTQSGRMVGQVGQTFKQGITYNTTTHNLSADEFDQVKHSLGLGDLDINNLIRNQQQQPQATGDLVSQLKQLDQAYEKRLISREEYDEARKRLIDNMGK